MLRAWLTSQDDVMTQKAGDELGSVGDKEKLWATWIWIGDYLVSVDSFKSFKVVLHLRDISWR